MTVENFMVTNVISASADQTIDEVINLLNEHKIRWVPIVDENKRLIGTFCTSQMIQTLLPKSATIEDGLQRLGFIIGASEDMAEKLHKIRSQKVAEHMDKTPVLLRAQTPTIEGFRYLHKHGSPLPVVDGETGVLVGILSDQSALENIKKIEDELEFTASGDIKDNEEE